MAESPINPKDSIPEEDSISKGDSLSKEGFISESDSLPKEDFSTEDDSLPKEGPSPESDTIPKGNSISEGDTIPKDSLSEEIKKDIVAKKKTKRMVIIFSVMALFVAAMLMCLPLLIEKAARDALIKIPKGATREMVHDSIAKYLDDGFASKMMRVAKVRGSDYAERHGAYLIEQGMSPLQAEHRLSHGAQEPITLTINHHRGLDALAKRIAAKLDFTADELISLVTDPEYLKQYGLTPDQALALFPEDTYEVYWSASPQGVMEKISDNFNKIWNEERLEKAKKLGCTPAEIMTVCSIVDEETNKVDEKGAIGRLYINRLKKGMKLQADPTVKFALGDFSLRRIRSNHLTVNSPYNTYRNTGLPPGLIRTTSVRTIDEILNSEPSDHIFMCAKEDFSGYHNFASNYQEHMANARRYQQALNKRGIK